MSGYLEAFLLLLIAAWFLGRDRKQWQQRLIVALSAPIGFNVGGLVGEELCAFTLKLHGRGNSHNDMIAVVAAAAAGGIVGSVVFFVVARWFTRKRQPNN